MLARGCRLLAAAWLAVGLTAGAPLAATAWAGGSECPAGYDQGYTVPDLSPEGAKAAQSQAKLYGRLPPTTLPAGVYELTTLEVTDANGQPPNAAIARLCRDNRSLILPPAGVSDKAHEYLCPIGEDAISFNNPEAPGFSQYGLEPRTTQWLAAGAYVLMARSQDGRNLILCHPLPPVASAIGTTAPMTDSPFDRLPTLEMVGLIFLTALVLTIVAIPIAAWALDVPLWPSKKLEGNGGVVIKDEDH